MVMNVTGVGSHYASGYVVGLQDGIAIIPLSFRPKMVIAVRDMDAVDPTGKLAYYTWDGTTETCKYQSGNRSGTVRWQTGTGAWAVDAVAVQVGVQTSTTVHTSYIAVG